MVPGRTSAVATPVVTDTSYAATAAAYVTTPTLCVRSIPATTPSSVFRSAAHSSSSMDSSTTNTTGGVPVSAPPTCAPPIWSMRYCASTSVSSGKAACDPADPAANTASELSPKQKQHLQRPFIVSTAQNGETNAAHRTHLAGSRRNTGSSGVG